MQPIYSFVLALTTTIATAQVGINTTTPTETLDINGSIRIRDTDKTSVIPTKIVGMDDHGVMVDVFLDENIKLEGNKLVAINQVLRFGQIALSDTWNNNVRLLIWPGEANEGKTIIKVGSPTSGTTYITGIDAGYDGLHVILQPLSGHLVLKANNSSSDPENHIEVCSNMSADKYEMMELVYDGDRKKWIIMQYF